MIREWTGEEDMENTIRKIMKWMGHVVLMDKDRRAGQMVTWVPEGKGEGIDHKKIGRRP